MISLGVIPARGGSKGVPLKNINPMCGKPLLVYAIRSARQSKLNRFLVSTDHPEIAEIARAEHAEVVMRPPELATDEALTEPCLLHAVDVMKDRHGFEPDVVLTLEPTSPFRSSALIDRAIEILTTTDADSVIGVKETRENYGRIVNNRFERLFPGQPRRRQDREPLYAECSTIYATRVNTLREKNLIFGDRLYPLIVPPEEAYDINTPLEFTVAEFLMSKKKNKETD